MYGVGPPFGGQFILGMTDTSSSVMARRPEGYWAIPLEEQWPGHYVMLVEKNVSWLVSPKYPKVTQKYLNLVTVQVMSVVQLPS